MDRQSKSLSKSFYLTQKTFEELKALEENYFENRSRVLSRLISEAYYKLNKEQK